MPTEIFIHLVCVLDVQLLPRGLRRISVDQEVGDNFPSSQLLSPL
jgi:hypothetical protein